MATQSVSLSKDRGVAYLILNSPPANALNSELLAALDIVLDQVAGDGEVRVVVIKSAVGKIFVAGADIKELAVSSRAEFGQYLDELRGVLDKIERLPKPTVAVISGHCLGGGCELALSCDFRLVSREKVRIGLPEIKLGLLPGGGGTQRLPRLIGYAKAKELIVLGKTVSGDEALGIGLVDRVCDSKELEADSNSFAQYIAELPTRAVAELKACLHQPDEVNFSAGLAVEKESVIRLFDETEDSKEGIQAFLNKRKPAFIGR